LCLVLEKKLACYHQLEKSKEELDALFSNKLIPTCYWRLEKIIYVFSSLLTLVAPKHAVVHRYCILLIIYQRNLDRSHTLPLAMLVHIVLN